jgi:hypothetical protein
MLIKAVYDAAIELATRADGGRYAPTLMPNEPVIMVAPIEPATEGPYLDNKRPRPDEIRGFTGDYIDPDVTDPDELWGAYAINPVGRTAAMSNPCVGAQGLRTRSKTPVMKICALLVPKEMKHVEFERVMRAVS